MARDLKGPESDCHSDRQAKPPIFGGEIIESKRYSSKSRLQWDCRVDVLEFIMLP
jgi:hypothetical protein